VRDPQTGQERKAKDNETPTRTEEKLIYILDPVEVRDWLIAKDGAEVRIFIGTEKGTNGYPDKSVIKRFIIPETVLNEAPADSGSLFEGEGGAEEQEGSDQAEEAPPPPPPQRQAAKPAPQQAKKSPPPPPVKTAKRR
jgi:hypothetical protein